MLHINPSENKPSNGFMEEEGTPDVCRSCIEESVTGQALLGYNPCKNQQSMIPHSVMYNYFCMQGGYFFA